MSDLQVRRRSVLRYSHSLRIIRRSAHGIDRELPSLLFGHGWQQRLPAHEIDRLEPVVAVIAEEVGCLERDEPQRNRARRMAQLVHYYTKIQHQQRQRYSLIEMTKTNIDIAA